MNPAGYAPAGFFVERGRGRRLIVHFRSLHTPPPGALGRFAQFGQQCFHQPPGLRPVSSAEEIQVIEYVI